MAEASLKSKAIRAKLLWPLRSRDYGEFTLHSTILVLDEPYLAGSWCWKQIHENMVGHVMLFLFTPPVKGIVTAAEPQGPSDKV